MPRALMNDFARGDDEAFERVVRMFSRPMFSAAYAVLGHRELAAEAVQQALVAAWKAAGSFDVDREITPWLCTITRRCAIDVWRAERRHVDSRQDVAPEPADEGAPSFEKVWEAWQIRGAIDNLPSDERDVVRLHYAGGHSHSQIAEVLGIPLGTVKSRTNRAHHRLQASLAHLAPVTAEGHPTDTQSGAQ